MPLDFFSVYLDQWERISCEEEFGYKGYRTQVLALWINKSLPSSDIQTTTDPEHIYLLKNRILHRHYLYSQQNSSRWTRAREYLHRLKLTPLSLEWECQKLFGLRYDDTGRDASVETHVHSVTGSGGGIRLLWISAALLLHSGGETHRLSRRIGYDRRRLRQQLWWDGTTRSQVCSDSILFISIRCSWNVKIRLIMPVCVTTNS